MSHNYDIIYCTSQETYNSIPEDYKGEIYIEFGTEKEPAILDRNFKMPVTLIGDNVAKAYGEIEVIARDNSCLRAFDKVRVIAENFSVITAKNEAYVEAKDSTNITGFDNSIIEVKSSEATAIKGADSNSAIYKNQKSTDQKSKPKDQDYER